MEEGLRGRWDGGGGSEGGRWEDRLREEARPELWSITLFWASYSEGRLMRYTREAVEQSIDPVVPSDAYM